MKVMRLHRISHVAELPSCVTQSTALADKKAEMWSASILLVVSCLVTPLQGVPPIWSQPEQVHISYPGVHGSMVVTWTTFNETESMVEYSEWGAKVFTLVAKGSTSTFVDGGSEKRRLFIHRVTLTALKPGSVYVYHCGSQTGWSDIFYFTALNESTRWSPRFALFGDMGNENPQSLARLQKETQAGMYDAILHIGDFAYDMDEDNARIGDEFMRQVEAIAAYVPYMTCPGNHEYKYNFSNYRNRFSMPGDTEGLWYSWNFGPAHIISFSTEVYFYIEYGVDLISKQYEWLKKDLEEASKTKNRQARPWIITMGHRPMYCSNDDKDDCTMFESLVRQALEDLFYIYGVDLELWAHEHTYERLWPVYKYKVYNGSREEPYVNPKAPVHIITGSAGCREKHDEFVPKPRDWSAFRSTDYGYTRMQVLNFTHLYLEQVSDDQNGKVIDAIWLVKERHGTVTWV